MIPVVLFTYSRPKETEKVLLCLRAERIPKLYIYSDAAKKPEDTDGVDQTRRLLKAIDWTDVTIVERAKNLGLGANVLSGVEEVASRHEAFIVWEDDLICALGTYQWICAALCAYRDDLRVGSITGWTHPRVTPPNITGPYFDGRAECWVWASWARAWKGMATETALEKMKQAERHGIARGSYGIDLPHMAEIEQKKNIWAVRWLYHHLQHNWLCVRPPWTLVEHIGFSDDATNSQGAEAWAAPPLSARAPLPTVWPEAKENQYCRSLWRTAVQKRSFLNRVLRRCRMLFGH